MIKSSNSGIDLEESRRWWDCGRKIRSEWTYEGRRTARRSRHYRRSRITPAAGIIAESRASQVETDGISACNKGSAYRKLYVERRGISPGGIAEV